LLQERVERTSNYVDLTRRAGTQLLLLKERWSTWGPTRAADGEEYVELANEPPAVDWAVRRDPFSTYRSGFEIRTYRLCRRILMFHRFPDELGVLRYLVRSTEFGYDEKPSVAF
jgi:hypothetical protein